MGWRVQVCGSIYGFYSNQWTFIPTPRHVRVLVRVVAMGRAYLGACSDGKCNVGLRAGVETGAICSALAGTAPTRRATAGLCRTAMRCFCAFDCLFQRDAFFDEAVTSWSLRRFAHSLLGASHMHVGFALLYEANEGFTGKLLPGGFCLTSLIGVRSSADD
jgi:hypothetical protein